MMERPIIPIFPPRPHGMLPWGQLSRYEKSGDWVVQRKFNGKHIVIHVNTRLKKVGIWGREQRPFVRFTPTALHFNEILSLNFPENEYWLAGELLHQKTKDTAYQGKIVLFDVLAAGEMLVAAPNQMGRLNILSQICWHPTNVEPHNGIALRVTENIWMAQTFERNFLNHFQEMLHLPEIEGLILRKKTSRLGNFGTRYYEVPWMVRCRKPTKSYDI